MNNSTDRGHWVNIQESPLPRYKGINRVYIDPYLEPGPGRDVVQTSNGGNVIRSGDIPIRGREGNFGQFQGVVVGIDVPLVCDHCCAHQEHNPVDISKDSFYCPHQADGTWAIRRRDGGWILQTSVPPEYHRQTLEAVAEKWKELKAP